MKPNRLQQAISGSERYRTAWLSDLGSIQPSMWDALAEKLADPFLEWNWLRMLELSQSTALKSGWLPHHLTVWSGDRLIAAAPLYVKAHSAGEFVFDHIWADVAPLGMIKVFAVITTQGVGDPGVLAGGISEALITTATGLTVAIPSLMFHRFFTARVANPVAMAMGIQRRGHIIHTPATLNRT